MQQSHQPRYVTSSPKDVQSYREGYYYYLVPTLTHSTCNQKGQKCFIFCLRFLSSLQQLWMGLYNLISLFQGGPFTTSSSEMDDFSWMSAAGMDYLRAFSWAKQTKQLPTQSKETPLTYLLFLSHMLFTFFPLPTHTHTCMNIAWKEIIIKLPHKRLGPFLKVYISNINQCFLKHQANKCLALEKIRHRRKPQAASYCKCKQHMSRHS